MIPGEYVLSATPLVINEGREAEYDRLTALLTRVRTMKLSGPCNDSAPRSRRNCSRVLT